MGRPTNIDHGIAIVHKSAGMAAQINPAGPVEIAIALMFVLKRIGVDRMLQPERGLISVAETSG